VIVLRACALGDLVLTGPLLERLADPFLVAHGEHVALARAAGWIESGCDADLAGLHALHGDEPDRARLAPALRERLARGEPALVLSRPGARRETLMHGLLAAGACEVQAYDPLPPPGVHAADHLASAGGPCKERVTPRIALPEEFLAQGPLILRARGLDPDTPPIALHPGAGAQTKCWPAKCWAATWMELRASGVPPLVLCGPADDAAARDLAQRIRAPILRELRLLDLAVVLAACRALLGHDSGVSHLAAALGVPTLALFGPSDPAQWAPRGPAADWLRAERGLLRDLPPAEVTMRARSCARLEGFTVPPE
jgi:ADP-heptose:LPS heptosyltransferase